jgi:hypothetical protein
MGFGRCLAPPVLGPVQGVGHQFQDGAVNALNRHFYPKAEIERVKLLQDVGAETPRENRGNTGNGLGVIFPRCFCPRNCGRLALSISVFGLKYLVPGGPLEEQSAKAKQY